MLVFTVLSADAQLCQLLPSLSGVFYKVLAFAFLPVRRADIHLAADAQLRLLVENQYGRLGRKRAHVTSEKALLRLVPP